MPIQKFYSEVEFLIIEANENNLRINLGKGKISLEGFGRRFETISSRQSVTILFNPVLCANKIIFLLTFTRPKAPRADKK